MKNRETSTQVIWHKPSPHCWRGDGEHQTCYEVPPKKVGLHLGGWGNTESGGSRGLVYPETRLKGKWAAKVVNHVRFKRRGLAGGRDLGKEAKPQPPKGTSQVQRRPRSWRKRKKPPTLRPAEKGRGRVGGMPGGVFGTQGGKKGTNFTERKHEGDMRKGQGIWMRD